MRRRTFVRPEAQTDIREAARWYETREIGLGTRFIEQVRATLRHIRRPDIWQARDQKQVS